MEQGPLLEDDHSADQDIPILKLNVHYRVHRSPTLHSVLSQITPLYNLMPYLLICFRIIPICV
jgi:hypothetical protein